MSSNRDFAVEQIFRADDFRADDFRADDFRADDFRADDPSPFVWHNISVSLTFISND